MAICGSMIDMYVNIYIYIFYVYIYIYTYIYIYVISPILDLHIHISVILHHNVWWFHASSAQVNAMSSADDTFEAVEEQVTPSPMARGSDTETLW